MHAKVVRSGNTRPLTPSTRSAATLTEALLVHLLIGFALWTLAAHAIGFPLGGSFLDLQRAAIPLLLLVHPLYRLLNALRREEEAAAPAPPAWHPPDWRSFALAGLLVAIHQFAAVYLPNSRLHLFWFLALLLLGRAWLASRHREGIIPRPAPPEPTGATLLFGLTLAATILVTLLAHRPDQDDQYYTNLAVMTLDHPERLLLSWNQMIQGADSTPWLPVDRLPTFELLVALLASWFDTEPIRITHLVLSPLFAGVTVGAHALLLRHLAPDRWLGVLMVEIFLLLALGGESRAGFGVFAFVQLHFGKSVLFSAILPLLLLFGLRFARSGDPRSWLLLCIGQIAAVGFSSSGLFLAPVAAGLGLIANWRPDLPATRRLLTGILASAYPLLIGLALMGAMSQALIAIDWKPLTLESNFSKVFGSGPHLWLYLLALTGAWSLMPDAGLRRTLLGLSFFFTAFFLNPFLYPLFSRHLTGAITTWRLNFALPLPAMAALMLLALFSLWNRERRPLAPLPLLLLLTLLLLLSGVPAWRALWSTPLLPLLTAAVVVTGLERERPALRPLLVLLALAATLASLTHLFSHQTSRWTTLDAPRTRLHAPGLKAPEEPFALARRVVELTPPGRSALLPADAAVWVPTLRHAPRLVATSRAYLEQLRAGLEPDAVENRSLLLDYVSGLKRPDDAPERLAAALAPLQIGLVAARTDNHPWLEEIDATLKARGFVPAPWLTHRIWIAPATPAP